ncbi:tyrosine-type recombinase/integrase [Neptuniibacter sp.]|uniref:tyrosine-type recombinase/integrase n=1 Tax=Neptuniibacter sp. TaxID=1962643 RepID=UPI003B5C970B
MARQILKTDKQIEAIMPIKGKRREYATSTPLLRVRVQPTGSKSFVWYFRDAEGKNRLQTLGTTEELTLDEATAALVSAKKQVMGSAVGSGRPSTVRDLTAKFYAMRIEGHREHPLVAKQILDKDINAHIGDLKLRTLSIQDVQAPIEQAIKRGSMGQARRILALTKQMLGYAYRQGFIAEPLQLKIEAKDAGVVAAKSRNRVLSDEEITAVFTVVEHSDMTLVFKQVLKLLLLTGLRSGEIRRNEWKNVDFDKGTITIPVNLQKSRNKVSNASDFIVPLTPLAMRAMRELHKQTGHTPLIMSGKNGDKPADDKALAQAMRRIRRRMNAKAKEKNEPIIPDWSPHDLRRTMRTGLTRMGVDSAVAELCLGHSLGKIFATYDLADTLDKRREAMMLWDKHISHLITFHPALEVVNG